MLSCHCRTNAAGWHFVPVLGLIAVGVLMWLNGASARADAEMALALYPPWWTPERAFSAAATAGNVVTLGRFPFSVAVQSPAPALPQRLRAGGALLVFSSTPDFPCVSARGSNAQ